MSKLILSGLIAAVLVTSTLAQVLKTCPILYQTTNPTGAADVAGAYGTPCYQIKNVPAGSCSFTATTPDVTCQFSLYWMGYRCCYQQTQATFATPAVGATFATLGPGTTPSPQNLKPKCPNSAMPSLTAYSNQPAVCNMTNLKGQPCPVGWTCVKASNVVDVYGTPNNPSDDLGAALTPNICCKTTTLSSYTNVFIEAGLSPTPIPSAPTAGIDSVALLTAGTTLIGLADDYSYVSNLLLTQPKTINLLTPTTIGVFYHILMFDSYTNRDCWFMANYAATAASKALPFTALAASPTAPLAGASVYNAGTTTSPKWTYSATWVAPTNNIVSHRFVVLVWTSTKALTFAAQNQASTTMLNLKTGLNGDFAPNINSQGTVQGGAFTTVTVLLKKMTTVMGTPKFGTYFYLMS